MNTQKQNSQNIFIPFILKGINTDILQNNNSASIDDMQYTETKKKNEPDQGRPIIGELDIHADIKQKLDLFRETNKIPHIIFHGSSGTGKFTLVYDFIKKIYGGDKQKIKTNVMIVNCSHGKGIKFIREELKFFAKINIQNNAGVQFKTILLLNAHHLTIDAQSALRRCIELFSYNTRFFIIVENKNKLLNPILSRFSDIYIPEYIENGKIINLHQYHINQKMRGSSVGDLKNEKGGNIETTDTMDNTDLPILDICLKWGFICQCHPPSQPPNFCFGNAIKNMAKLNSMVEEMYNSGVSCLDFMEWAGNTGLWTSTMMSLFNMKFNDAKLEFRCEKLLLFWVIEMMVADLL